jgi:ATP diphosphatase
MKQTDDKNANSLPDGMAPDLAALQRALELQLRGARAGFDWPAPGPVLDKLQEEVAELRAAMNDGQLHRVADELGDLLFTVVNLARKLGIDPAMALRHANGKFERRFRALEQQAGGRAGLRRLTLDEMEALWQAVKKREAADE